MNNCELHSVGKGMKIRGIVGLILIFTLVGAIATLIMALIDGIKILATNWKNKQLDDEKLLWGLLTLLILGPIGEIVFGCKIISQSENPTFDPMNNSQPF